jgi:hypothetical protein
VEKPQSLRAWCRSEWQTPQYRISIATSLPRSSRRLNSKRASGTLASVAAYPVVFMKSLFWLDAGFF